MKCAGLTMAALVGCASVACGAFGSSDSGGGSGVATGSTGVTLRGISKKTGTGLREIVVPAPDGGRPGDTIWAVLSTSQTNVTPPTGFEVVNSDSGFSCGPFASDMYVFVHAIADGEPTEYKFLFAGVTEASASLVTLGGLVNGSTTVETSVFARVPMSPFEVPKVSAAGPAYAIASYMVENATSLTFTVPAGMNRLFEGNGTAIFGRDVEAAGAIEVEPVQGSKLDACGYVHLGLLRRR